MGGVSGLSLSETLGFIRSLFDHGTCLRYTSAARVKARSWTQQWEPPVAGQQIAGIMQVRGTITIQAPHPLKQDVRNV